MKLFSHERYRASALERRLHGGNTVTKYLVQHDGGSSFYVYGLGKTQHDRKRFAEQHAKALIESGAFKNHLQAHLAAR